MTFAIASGVLPPAVSGFYQFFLANYHALVDQA
jgi:hypothetical protein